MSAFTDPLDLQYLDGHNWQLLTEFDYFSSVLMQTLHIPAGFVTDFASIPRPLWNILPPTGQYGKAAVVHDYLYRTPGLRVSRALADKVLLEAMGVLGVGRLTRWVIYSGVRVGGAASYKGGA